MNPNQLMIAKAMVAQDALRDEALRSRRRGKAVRPPADRRSHRMLGLLRRR